MFKSTLKNIESQVLILVGTHCQHCAPVLSSLSDLTKEGVIDSLQIVNVEKTPDVASELGVKSVPWIRIGWFELEGVRTKDELARWVAYSQSTDGVREYYAEILQYGRVQQCLSFLDLYPKTMPAVLQLMSNPDEKINIKLGVGVIMEECAASEHFEPFVSQLAEFLTHEDARVRQDACHYLSLTKKTHLISIIEPLLNDENDDVREEAEDSITALQDLLD